MQPERIAVLCAMLLCGSAVAADYRLELVIFDQLNPDVDGEQLQELPAFPEPPTEALYPWDETPTGPAVLPNAEALPQAWQQLRYSAQYRPLLQLAWVQPSWSRAPSLRLPSVVCHPQGPSSTAIPILQGAVHFVDTGRLHLEIDLAYRRCAADSGEDSPIIHVAFRRRVLLKQLHYLDHPLVGVIFRVQREPES